MIHLLSFTIRHGENGKLCSVSSRYDGYELSCPQSDGTNKSVVLKDGERGLQGERGWSGYNGRDGTDASLTTIHSVEVLPVKAGDREVRCKVGMTTTLGLGWSYYGFFVQVFLNNNKILEHQINPREREVELDGLYHIIKLKLDDSSPEIKVDDTLYCEVGYAQWNERPKQVAQGSAV